RQRRGDVLLARLLGRYFDIAAGDVLFETAEPIRRPKCTRRTRKNRDRTAVGKQALSAFGKFVADVAVPRRDGSIALNIRCNDRAAVAEYWDVRLFSLPDHAIECRGIGWIHQYRL